MFSNVASRGLRIRVAAAAPGQTVAPHAASGRRVPCGAPTDAPTPHQASFTHLAVRLGSSRVGGFPLHSYSTLGQLGSHCALLHNNKKEQNKKERKGGKSKKPGKFWRFKSPAQRLTSRSTEMKKKKDRISFFLTNCGQREEPTFLSVNPAVDELKLKDGRQTPASISTATRNRPETPPSGRGFLDPSNRHAEGAGQFLRPRDWNSHWTSGSARYLHCLSMKLNFIVSWWSVILRNLVSIH